MKFERLGLSACEKIYNSWIEKPRPSSDLKDDAEILRNEILVKDSLVRLDIRSGIPKGRLDKYQYDILLGLEIYELLNASNGFSMRCASDPDVWRFITMKVVPDLVYERWGKESSDRYYRRPTRIYLSSLWWYIHLSWDENKRKTYEIIKGNSTDEIMNLVERSGPMGYRVDFTRELMREYAKRTKDDRYLFRKVLKLNTARSIVIEPGLHTNGVEGYVRELFEDVLRGELHEEASGSY